MPALSDALDALQAHIDTLTLAEPAMEVRS